MNDINVKKLIELNLKLKSGDYDNSDIHHAANAIAQYKNIISSFNKLIEQRDSHAKQVLKQKAHIEKQNEDARLVKNEADSLALSLWRRHFSNESPVFELCDSSSGVISQIDNMSAGLSEEIDQLKKRVAELEKIVNSVAHIGVDIDCGTHYQPFEIGVHEIEKARELMSNDN